MSSAANLQPASPFRVNLDQEVTILPPRALRSMAGLFMHLEGVANRENKTSFSVNDGDSDKSSKWPPMVGLGLDSCAPIRLRDLGHQLIKAAAAQIRLLQSRVHEAQSLILINNWQTAQRLWLSLEAECRTPLYELNVLEHLWGFNPALFRVDGSSIERHRQKFVLIQLYIKMLLAGRESLVELSNALEIDLGCWLARFARILEKLEYESVA